MLGLCTWFACPPPPREHTFLLLCSSGSCGPRTPTWWTTSEMRGTASSTTSRVRASRQSPTACRCAKPIPIPAWTILDQIDPPSLAEQPCVCSLKGLRVPPTAYMCSVFLLRSALQPQGILKHSVEVWCEQADLAWWWWWMRLERSGLGIRWRGRLRVGGVGAVRLVPISPPPPACLSLSLMLEGQASSDGSGRATGLRFGGFNSRTFVGGTPCLFLCLVDLFLSFFFFFHKGVLGAVLGAVLVLLLLLSRVVSSVAIGGGHGKAGCTVLARTVSHTPARGWGIIRSGL